MSCRPSQQKDKMMVLMGDEPKSRRTSVTLPIVILKKIKAYCLDHNQNLSEVLIDGFTLLCKNAEAQKRKTKGGNDD